MTENENHSNTDLENFDPVAFKEDMGGSVSTEGSSEEKHEEPEIRPDRYWCYRTARGLRIPHLQLWESVVYALECPEG